MNQLNQLSLDCLYKLGPRNIFALGMEPSVNLTMDQKYGPDDPFTGRQCST